MMSYPTVTMYNSITELRGSRSTHRHANSLNGQIAESEVISSMSRVAHLSDLLMTFSDPFPTMSTARV